MPTTGAPFALPYPTSGDIADVPLWLAALADRVHEILSTQDNTALNFDALTEGLSDRLDLVVPPAVAAAIAADPTVASAAASAVVSALAADTSIARGEALDAYSGWRWAFMYADREIALGQRTDGTFYPDTAGGSGGGAVTVDPVVIWGDSMTQGWTTSHLSAALAGRPVTAQGIGGQDADNIAARQGGAPTLITVPGDVIPASGTVTATVTVGLGSGATAGVLQGVAGTLDAGVFTRTTPGMPVSCPPGSPFQTGHSFRNHWPIFWAGRNTYKTAEERTDLLAKTAAMMAWTNRRDRALVLSVPPWADEYLGGPFSSTRVNLNLTNTMLRDAWPGHYLDLAAMLRRATTLEAVGITPTAQDLTDIANDVTPSSFRAPGDPGHWNDAAYQAAALLIAMTYASKGWT